MRALSHESTLLNRVTESHPSLRELRGEIADDAATLDAGFIAAYRNCNVGYAKKSLLLRILLGDPSAAPVDAIAPRHLSRLADWWRAHDALRFGDAGREITPKGVVTALGLDRTTLHAFTSRAFLQPWWTLRGGDGPAMLTAYERLPPDELSAALAPVAHARILTDATARELLEDRDHRLTVRHTEWFFATGVAAIDLRNTLVYLAHLIDGDRDGGRVQNLIPLALSRAWRLPRLNLPAVIAFADVAALALTGVIERTRLVDDPNGLGPILNDPVAVKFVTGQDGAYGADDAARAMRAHAMRWIITPDWMERAAALREDQRLKGRYDNGFMFNSARLLANQPVIAAMSPYAEAIECGRLIDACASPWTDIDPALATHMHQLAAASVDMPGLRARDLGNIAAFLRSANIRDETEAFAALPTVARWALGAPSPMASMSNARTARISGPDTSVKRAATGDLPLFSLVALSTARRSRACLLVPGYTGIVPRDCPVFTHRVFRSFAVPHGVEFVGNDTLEWFEDPVALAHEELTKLGFAVEVLSGSSAAT